ncbi:MAG: potassium-transporting ATPase subunit KdpB [Euryarchaeota archaeon]|nr:potassium-transporting ATPase subunit KdpB [Euryarchaeota archaeon]MDE1837672.1 potassium-transporting ATPase subunit KdpB [Euryarchaeota archaeon]MDE1880347.1 potassium-transporting ATPase subunit KdpB [Euryarchaeota archaeon]MDE2046344.1 potassium-transporting ATPase subunit KdpB [Thermoplasmata archaeon]
MGASGGVEWSSGARVSVRRRLHTSWALVVKTSLLKFSPREQVRNPIMFVVYACFFLLLFVGLFPGLFPDILREGFDQGYFLAVAAILLLTLWFANLAEAIAEAQGKAQADTLRTMRSGLQARQILPDGKRTWVAPSHLHIGDLVECRPGDTIPLDGDVVKGGALIDESMMTGESEAVLRESGGDRTSVLGGSKVLRGTMEVRVTAEPGTSFLDRMIRLVEGTSRDKSPNEISLTIILTALTAALLVVVLTLAYLLRFSGLGSLNIATLIALTVCLAPTTIGGLLSAIGISGVNRVAKANVVAKSGKAIEAAGDLDILILDKTGTITVGNRLAVQFIPAPGVDPAELLRAALLSSTLDDTPEGRSIARLATLRGARTDPSIRVEEGRVVPFSPSRRMSGFILEDGTEAMKGAISAVEAYAGPLPVAVRQAGADSSRQGMTPLVIALSKRVMGIVVLKDVVKPGIHSRLQELKLMGIRTIMCTGDNRLTAASIAKESGVDDFVAEAKPETKLALIGREKAYGHLVAMTGDGTNDAPALARADVGLAMNSGTSAAKEAGNMVDLDSDPTKIIEVISIGKQLLITRGALTTFSITNDVAKYFAIVPALFVSNSNVAILNVLGLSDPKLAVLAAVLFNALMIPALIPLALRGASFRAATAVELLRRNLVLYGFGGLLSAFVGIKLIYFALSNLPPDLVSNLISKLAGALGVG